MHLHVTIIPHQSIIWEIMVDELSKRSRAEHEGAKLLRSWGRSGWWLFFETLKILDIFSKTCKRTFVEESVRSLWSPHIPFHRSISESTEVYLHPTLVNHW